MVPPHGKGHEQPAGEGTDLNVITAGLQHATGILETFPVSAVAISLPRIYEKETSTEAGRDPGRETSPPVLWSRDRTQ